VQSVCSRIFLSSYHHFHESPRSTLDLTIKKKSAVHTHHHPTTPTYNLFFLTRRTASTHQ